MAGLAYSLGFADRHSLLDYKGKPEFTSVVTRAKLRIESDNIEKGITGEYEAKTNNLNLASNFGYGTKSEIDVKADVGITVTQTVYVPEKPADDRNSEDVD